MANLAGRTALVVDGAGVATAALAEGLAAGLTEAAATVHHADHQTVAARLEQLAAAGAAVDVLVAAIETLQALPEGAAAVVRSGLVIALVGPAPAPAEVRSLAAMLAPAAAPTLLALQPAAPGVSGRCVAALAMDPDVADKAGGSYQLADLAREYRFTDPDAADPLQAG